MSYQISLPSTQHVQNVVPGDFNRDGKLDLLVMSITDPRDNTLEMMLYAGAHGGFGRPIRARRSPRTLTTSRFWWMQILILSHSPHLLFHSLYL